MDREMPQLGRIARIPACCLVNEPRGLGETEEALV